MTTNYKQPQQVSTDALATLGTIITESEGRDAIHLAVENVVAAEKLFPGQDIGFVEGGVGASAVKKLGIVDPFLSGPVYPGQRFWLIVYPRQITSLRHVWSHPDFPDDPAPTTEELEQLLVEMETFNRNHVAKSEAWLRDFIANSDCPGYDEVINAVLYGDSWDRDYIHFNGDDAHGDIPDEFWDHMEVVTGRKFEHRAKWFSCSC